MSRPPLPDHVRIAYIDVRTMGWGFVGSVAFHSFAWPRGTKDATGIARTLFVSHCGSVDVLVVRGRCFGSNHVCFRVNRVFDNSLWGWSSMVGRM